MADSRTSKKDSSTNDGLALIIGGLFVLALVFATYSYFNRSNTLDQDVKSGSTERADEDGKQASSLGERLRELFGANKDEDTDVGGKGGPVDMLEKEETGAETYSVFEQWVATDYEQGDISGSSYVVKSGDTLWEIAEARYGNGAEWTKILDANSSDVGFLPSGQQSLIVPGQTLVLP
jgi:nucleoid-associated protein YgaU